MKSSRNIKVVMKEKVDIQPRLKPEVEARLEQIEKDFEEGKNLSPVFTNVEDMFKYLNSLG